MWHKEETPACVNGTLFSQTECRIIRWELNVFEIRSVRPSSAIVFHACCRVFKKRWMRSNHYHKRQFFEPNSRCTHQRTIDCLSRLREHVIFPAGFHPFKEMVGKQLTLWRRNAWVTLFEATMSLTHVLSWVLMTQMWDSWWRVLLPSTFVAELIPFYSDCKAGTIYSMLLLTKLRFREEKLLPSNTRHMAP